MRAFTLDEIENPLQDANAPIELFARASSDLAYPVPPNQHPGDERAAALVTRVQQSHDQSDDPPVTVQSPLRTYALLGRLAVGDVADIHLACAANDPRIVAESYYTLKVSRIPAGHALLDNEWHVLARLLAEAGDTTYCQYLPALAESFTARDDFHQRVNVFLHQPGLHTLEQVHRQHPALDGRHLAWIFKRLLTVLGFSHRQQTVHGAVLPCHVLVHAPNHGLQLIGWGQSVGTARPIRALLTRFKDWYPPEVLSREPSSPAADLFLAARCMIYLAGGDPVRDRMPDAVPAPLQRFLQGCLLESPRMRPGDAWALLDEFDKLLLGLYGPPKFHTLALT